MATEDTGRLIPLLEEFHGTFVLNEKACQILNSIGDKEVAVYSINGKQGTGKSFMLNCFLSYLENRGNENWLTDNFINGFKSGKKNHTMGVCMWSKPYFIPIKGENCHQDREVAVLLLDTQGCFEVQSSFIKSAIVSTMSAALSSFYIYNVDGHVDKDDYMFLRLITKFAISIDASTHDVPMHDNSILSFQNLLILSRNEIEENFFGYHPLRDNNFKISNLTPNQIEYFENEFSLACIRNFFSEIKLFSLPFPGKVFSCQNIFNGCIDPKNEELLSFFKYVENFVASILDDNRIVVKKHGTTYMTASRLSFYLTQCLGICDFIIREAIQEDRTVTETKSQVQAITVFDAMKDYYKEKMYIVLNEGPLISEDFKAKHDSIWNEIQEIFQVAVSHKQYYDKYNIKLKTDIKQNLFMQLQISNSTRYDMKIIEVKLLEAIKELDNLNQKNHPNQELIDNRMKAHDNLMKIHDEEMKRLRKNQIILAFKFGRNFLYKMNSKPRGFCVLINNMRFPEVNDYRKGADADIVKFRVIFSTLHFTIKEEANLSAINMVKFLEGISNHCRPEHNALVVIVSSHGANEVLIGSDGKKLKINHILKIFNNENCVNLKGKPKIFFFLACRGVERDHGVRFEQSVDDRCYPTQALICEETSFHFSEHSPISNETKYEINSSVFIPTEDVGDLKRLPVFSDMFICYSSMKGYISVRDTITGTWFGQELCNVLDRYASKCDLETMLKMVTAKVFQRGYSGLVQSVSIELIGWLKNLYFNTDI